MSSNLLTETSPYLINAIYSWIIDKKLTPYITAQILPGVKVPPQFKDDDHITLNIAPFAIRDLCIKDNFISFDACFSGLRHSLYFPMHAVISIYSLENKQGIIFQRNTDNPCSICDLNGNQFFSLFSKEDALQEQNINTFSKKDNISKPKNENSSRPKLSIVPNIQKSDELGNTE